jgi:DNA-binding XRE family transcriptional regulator
MPTPKVADHVRELRKALNLGQVAFAKKIGASPTTIQHYEVGSRRPDPHTLAKLVGVAVKAQQWLIAKDLAQLLPGVKEGLLKPTWGEYLSVQVTRAVEEE